MTYKELYNIVKQLTDNFTKESGDIGVTSRADRDNAYNILMKAYSDVKKEGLNYGATSEDEVNMYKLSYSGRLLDLPEEEYITVNEAMIEKHDKLNPKLWDSNNELKPEVREKIEEIVEKFKKGLEENEVKLDVEDVCLIGSNASYNYNPTSDVDLHIIANTSVYSDEDLALKTYLAYKSLFNDKYDPTIRGIEVEVYVEPNEVHANSKGVYSLEKGWLKEPEASDVPEVDEEEIADAAQPYIDRADKLFDNGTVEEIDNLIDDIYLQRQQSIMKDGEFAKGNLIFKFIRSMGLLQDLRDKKTALENEKMSLEENDMDEFGLKDIFIDEDIEDDGPEMFELAKGQKYTLGPNHYIIIRDISGDHVSCSEVEDDEVYDYDESRLPLQTMLFEYDAKLEDELVEEVEEKSNGMTFKFPDTVDTLTVYLSWEGIEGFLNDILDFADVGEGALRAYLEDEGIYGYTLPIMNIINGGSAFCQGMDMSDFMAVCEDNFIDYTKAIEDDDITVTESVNKDYKVGDKFKNANGATLEIIKIGDEAEDDYAEFKFGNGEIGSSGHEGIDAYLKDWEKIDESLVEEEKDSLVSKSTPQLKKMLKDASEEEAKKIKAELNCRGVYLKGRGPKNEDTVFDTMPGYMTPEEIRALEKEKADAAKAEKDAERAEKKAANKERARAERARQKRIEQREKVNNLDYDSLADMAGLPEDNNDLTKDELLGVLRAIMSDEEILKLHKEMFEDYEAGIPGGPYENDDDYILDQNQDYDNGLPDPDEIPFDNDLTEAKKVGLVAAAKSVLNRLCKKYEDASPEEIYSKALEVAGRSDSPFVKDNLTSKKEEAIKFINGHKEATNLGEAVNDFKPNARFDIHLSTSGSDFGGLDLRNQPDFWGLDTEEEFEEEVGKYDGQVCEATCIVDNDSEDPSDNFYDLEFADGHVIEGVSGLEIDFFADEN